MCELSDLFGLADRTRLAGEVGVGRFEFEVPVSPSDVWISDVWIIVTCRYMILEVEEVEVKDRLDLL